MIDVINARKEQCYQIFSLETYTKLVNFAEMEIVYILCNLYYFIKNLNKNQDVMIF